MLRTRRIISASFLLLVSFFAEAQMARLYTSEDGLPGSQINSVFQDSRGQMWVATENGLARFDGMDFSTFRFNRSRPGGIASNLVLQMFEDSEGTMWVGTSSGLQIFNPDYNSFTIFDLGDNEVPGSTQHVSSIAEIDREIWVACSQHGIYVIDKTTHSLRPERREALRQLIPSQFVSKVFQDSDGIVWLASETGGLWAVEPWGPTLKGGLWDAPLRNIGAEVLVEDFVQDTASGDLLIGTSNHGLFRYSKDSGHITRCAPGQSDARVMSLLRNRLIQRAGDRTFLVGTEDHGILVYDLESDRLREALLPNVSLNTSHWKIHDLFEDNQGNIWAGAYEKGLLVLPKSMFGFEYIRMSPDGATGDNIACVTSILRDRRDGTLWVGTDGGGLVHMDASGKTTFFTEQNSGMSNNSVMSIVQDKRGTIWIATYLGGLVCHKDGQGFRTVAGTGKIGSGRASCLAYDEKQDILYMGTNGDGLAVFSAAEEKLLLNISEDINKWVSALLVDRSGLLWIGTFNGPMCYNHETGQMVSYNSSEELGVRVYSFCEGRGGRMWIGTGEGLVAFDRATGKSRLWSESEGLSNNVVAGVLENSDGTVWAATSYGLSRLNPATGEVSAYYASDGLQENEFRYGAVYHDPDGLMFFGGIGGITAFHPQMVGQKSHGVPPVYFTRLEVMNEPVEFDASADRNVLDKHISEASLITLPLRKGSFSLSFAVPEFTNPKRVAYAYKMDRYDQAWHLGHASQRTATYNNLPSGRYTLSVRAFFEGSEDEFSSASIGIHILPPWYLTPGAFAFYLMGLGLGIYLLVKALQARRRHAQEKEESEIKELKLMMFTNISHEIRTPLTLVMSPLKRLREAEQNPKQKDLYNLMYRNCLRINRMVNQLMDMRKIDSGQMQMHFLETDIVYFIKDIMQSFDNLAVTKNIDFSLEAAEEVSNIWIDQGNFDKIIFNILSNAFKNTPDGGSIKLRISAPAKNKGALDASIAQYVGIDIANSGSHIADGNLDRVFERFFQTDVLDAKVGSGVGLSLAKQLVGLHHGSISARNDEQGVVFTILMPKGNAHLSEEEMSKTTHHKDLYTKSLDLEKLSSSTEDMDFTTDDGPTRNVKSRRSIVIVEDDAEFRSYLKMELGPQYNVETFASAESAWGTISTTVPDIVITDLKMEGPDGAELCEKIKRNPGTSHVPVIILTSSNDEDSIRRCTDSGADRYFTKPISVDLLLSVLSNTISNRDAVRNKFSNLVDYNYSQIKIASSKELIAKVLDTIKAHIDDTDFGVEDLSREVGMSRVHMNRKLKEALGLSPSNLIKSIRLKQAAYLLIGDKVNISEVAYKVGFSTHSYFSSAFREYFGMSPKEFVAKYMNCTDEETLRKIFQ